MFTTDLALVQTRVLKVANDEGVIAFALGANRIANHLAGAAHFHDRMGVGIVRSYALDVDLGARIDNRRKVRTQSIPVSLSMLVIDEALVPDAHRCLH